MLLILPGMQISGRILGRIDLKRQGVGVIAGRCRDAARGEDPTILRHDPDFSSSAPRTLATSAALPRGTIRRVGGGVPWRAVADGPASSGPAITAPASRRRAKGSTITGSRAEGIVGEGGVEDEQA